jgi:hypothetical protein
MGAMSGNCKPCCAAEVVAQVGVNFAWQNKFRPTTLFFAGPNFFGLVQTGPLPQQNQRPVTRALSRLRGLQLQYDAAQWR